MTEPEQSVPTVIPTPRLVAEMAMPRMRSAVQASIARLQAMQDASTGTSSLTVTRQLEGLQAVLINLAAVVDYASQLETLALQQQVSVHSLDVLVGMQAAYVPDSPVSVPATPTDGGATPPAAPTPTGVGSLLPLIAWQQGWTAGWGVGRTAGWLAAWPVGWAAGARALMADVLARIAARL